MLFRSKKWTMRDVLKVTKKAKIEDELRNGGVALGSSQMISKYQATITRVVTTVTSQPVLCTPSHVYMQLCSP